MPSMVDGCLPTERDTIMITTLHDYPTITQLYKQLRAIKPRLWDHPHDGDPIDVRLQVVPGEGWALHDGDPQYDTDHRGYWGYGTIDPRTNCRELAKDLIEQCRDHAAQCADTIPDTDRAIQVVQYPLRGVKSGGWYGTQRFIGEVLCARAQLKATLQRLLVQYPRIEGYTITACPYVS